MVSGPMQSESANRQHLARRATVMMFIGGAIAQRRFWQVLAPIWLALATMLACPAQAQRTAITGVTVLPSPEAPVIPQATILIDGAAIVAVGPASEIAIPKDYARLDGQGGFVTAGFWNAHVHLLDPRFLGGIEVSDDALSHDLVAKFSRWGFTTVVDLASSTGSTRAIAQRMDAPHVLGPRILTVGEPFYPAGATPIYAKPIYDQYNLPSAEVVSTVQAKVRVRDQLDAGADAIKIFSGSIVGGKRGIVHMDSAIIAAIVAAAHDRGKPVIAHPTDQAGIDVAVAGGADILAHAAPLMGPWTDTYARKLANSGVALIPTLSLFAQIPDPATPVDTAVAQAAAFDRAGGAVLFGTDAGFTDIFDPSAEFDLMAQAIGLPALLAALTTRPAEQFGEQSRRGRVVPGFAADLVLLGSDPRASVQAYGDVKMVVRSGRVQFTADKQVMETEAGR